MLKRIIWVLSLSLIFTSLVRAEVVELDVKALIDGKFSVVVMSETTHSIRFTNIPVVKPGASGTPFFTISFHPILSKYRDIFISAIRINYAKTKDKFELWHLRDLYLDPDSAVTVRIHYGKYPTGTDMGSFNEGHSEAKSS